MAIKLLSLLMFIIIVSGCSHVTTNTNSILDTNKPINTTNKNINTNTTIITKNTLDLSGKGLSEIPESTFDKTNLTELNVSNNNLTGAIQAEIRHLQNLQILNASNNKMTGAPAEIGQLQNLRILNLSDNQLTGLPYELGNLKNLQTLNLSGNNYSEYDLNIITKSLPSDINIIK